MSTFTFPETDLIGCKYSDRDLSCAIGRNTLPKLNPQSREYIYRLLPGATKPQVGDFAVVANVNGINVCVVTTINAMSSYKLEDMAYVIGTVSPAAFKDEIQKEQTKKLLKAKIDKRKKELEELVTLDLLAEKCPDFKELLDAYKAL